MTKIIKDSKKFNILNMLNKLKLDYKENNNEIILKKCPNCGNEKYKLYMNPDTKQFFCFVCEFGKHMNLAHFLSKIQDVPYESAVAQIIKIDRNFNFDQLSNNLKDISSSLESIMIGKTSIEKNIIINYIDLPEDYVKLYPFNPELLEVYVYLDKRGILDKTIIEMFDLRYDYQSKRLVFPIRYNNKYVGWQRRDVTKRWTTYSNYPKALTGPEGFKKSLFLYNYDNAINKDYITLVEGPIDAIKSAQCNSIALLGKTLSETQLSLLKSLKSLKTVIIGIDPGETKAVDKLARQLDPFFEVRVIEYDSNADLGSRTFEEVNKLVNDSIKYDFYKKR